MILIPGYQLLMAPVSYVTGLFQLWVNALYDTMAYGEEVVMTTLDDGLYYIMNALMVILYFFDMIAEVKENVSHNVGIITSGYKNGFISNIN